MPTFRGKPVFRRQASLDDYKTQPGYFAPPEATPVSDEEWQSMKDASKKAPAKPAK
jgi:hypothetical protein